MTTAFKESSPKRFQTNRSKGRGGVLAQTGGGIGARQWDWKKNKNPQDTACLNNPKLFFNHSLENWLGPSAGDSCSAPQPFNENH